MTWNWPPIDDAVPVPVEELDPPLAADEMAIPEDETPPGPAFPDPVPAEVPEAKLGNGKMAPPGSGEPPGNCHKLAKPELDLSSCYVLPGTRSPAP